MLGHSQSRKLTLFAVAGGCLITVQGNNFQTLGIGSAVVDQFAFDLFGETQLVLVR